MTSYVFDNAAVGTPKRFGALEACLDDLTIRQLLDRGVGPGWTCLEVGGGGGSIGRWLSGQVGVKGRVLVTDIDTRWITTGGPPNLTVLQHDIVCDDLPEAVFDLVHARLVLVHLPARHHILRRLIRALRPGGWIVVEEFDFDTVPITVFGDPAAQTRFDRVYRVMSRVLQDAGLDYGWGRSLLETFMIEPLVAVAVEGNVSTWSGGSPWGDLFLTNVDQLEDRMLATGDVTPAAIDDFRSLVDDPGLVFNTHLTVSARGRRPF